MELQPHKYYKKRIAELEQKMAVALDKMELVQKELFLVKAEYEQWKEQQKWKRKNIQYTKVMSTSTN